MIKSLKEKSQEIIRGESLRIQNPIIRGFYPDPSICRRGDDYFLVNSSFDYFPGLPLFHSKNLIEWRQIGNCLTRNSQLDLKDVKSSLGIFAPTIRFINERFYVVFTNTNIGENLLIATEDPFNEWSEPLALEWGGIDPSLFQDADGTVYIQGTAERYGEEKGIYQAQIDLETGKLRSPRKLISKGTGHKSPEGPHLYHKDDWYYLMMAEGGTEYGHMETIFRSKTVDGPFEAFSDNPILTNRSTGSKLQCVGHADLIDTPNGEWFAVCLGTRIKGSHNYYHFLGRETNLAPVKWTEDAWPYVAGRMLVTDFKQFEDYEKEAENSTKYDFTALNDFSEEWLHISNPIKENYVFSDKGLQLKGASDLSEIGQPTFVGLRQDEFDYNFAVEFELDTKNVVETGITVYMSHDFHVDFFLKGENYKNSLWVRKKIASFEIVEKLCDLHEEVISIRTTCDGEKFLFEYLLKQKWVIVAEIETIFLSTEISGTFTGVLLGIYASGQKTESGVWITNLQVEKNCE